MSKKKVIRFGLPVCSTARFVFNKLRMEYENEHKTATQNLAIQPGHPVKQSAKRYARARARQAARQQIHE